MNTVKSLVCIAIKNVGRLAIRIGVQKVDRGTHICQTAVRIVPTEFSLHHLSECYSSVIMRSTIPEGPVFRGILATVLQEQMLQ